MVRVFYAVKKIEVYVATNKLDQGLFCLTMSFYWSNLMNDIKSFIILRTLFDVNPH